MTTQEMIDLASGLGRDDLLALYDQIVTGDTPGWAPGRAFEHLVLRAFELEGAEVQWPYTVPMLTSEETLEQIDGAVYWDGLAFLTEAKDTREPVNVEPIAKLKAQLDRRPPQTLGLVVSRGGFTIPAVTLTYLIAGGRVILWRGDEFRYALAGGGVLRALRQKFRWLVERGAPDLITITADPTAPTGLPQPGIPQRGQPDGPDAQGD